jgi:hypothetical protein
VFILTDGSGHSGSSRLAASTRLLQQAGATRGSIFGALTDQHLYAAILHHDFARFQVLAERLAEALSDPTIDYVVGDAMEGYNPGHDVCRVLIERAVALAGRGSGFGNFAFKLTGSPSPLPDTPPGEVVRLDAEALQRKITESRRYTELAEDVEAALEAFGAEAFRDEHLPRARPGTTDAASSQPFYESRGERQVANRHYREVLRYEEHVRPLVAALGAR